MMKRRLALQRPAAVLLALMLTACAAPAAQRHHARKTPTSRAAQDANAPRYAGRAEVMALADDIAARHDLDAAWVASALADARRLPSVLRLIAPPPAGTAKDWAAYRARFLDPGRIRAGVAFWRDNEKALAEAESRWGVPPAIVVGILGVETIYGRNMGRYRVLDALATLAFDFPAEQARRDRSAYFKSELESYLVLCNRERMNPTDLLGSYAGASGMPQFMPSSILNKAVDFDGDGHIDLQGSAADAIGSVAHYLAEAGWQPGMPTHYAVGVPVNSSDRATLLQPDILPTFTPEQFAEHGAALDEAGRAHVGPLALVELQNGDAAPTYVAGTQNFYAITRYNQSSYYAMAVIELGDTVRAVVQATR